MSKIKFGKREEYIGLVNANQGSDTVREAQVFYLGQPGNIIVEPYNDHVGKKKYNVHIAVVPADDIITDTKDIIELAMPGDPNSSELYEILYTYSDKEFTELSTAISSLVKKLERKKGRGRS